MNSDSIRAYESNARAFLQCRDTSSVGMRVADRWARSLAPGADVIEIACGGGIPVTRTLVDAGLNVWAIDASPSLVSVFKSRFPGIPVQCSPALESDYFQRTFDAAISIGLIFLLDESDQHRMLRRAAEILQPGASFLFTAPMETGTWTDVNTGHPCLSLGQGVYEQALEQSGFRVIRHYEDSGKNNYYEAEKVAGSSTPNTM